MKKVVLILAVVTLNGCATAHQYCIAHANEYADYDQCYAERKERSEKISRAFSQMGKTPAYKQTSCTSNVIGNTVYTNCN